MWWRRAVLPSLGLSVFFLFSNLTLPLKSPDLSLPLPPSSLRNTTYENAGRRADSVAVVGAARERFYLLATSTMPAKREREREREREICLCPLSDPPILEREIFSNTKQIRFVPIQYLRF